MFVLLQMITPGWSSVWPDTSCRAMTDLSATRSVRPPPPPLRPESVLDSGPGPTEPSVGYLNGFIDCFINIHV